MGDAIRRRAQVSASIRRREAGAGRPPKLAGYAAVFDSWTTLHKSSKWEVRERIRPGAFRNAIVQRQDVRALVDHNPTLILGRTKAGTLRLLEDSRGLAVEIDPPSSGHAEGVMESVRRGDVDQMSFAFTPRPGGERTSTRFEGALEITEVEITDVDLYDVSLVTYPAYRDTSVAIRGFRPDIARRIAAAGEKEARLAEARAWADSIERRLAAAGKDAKREWLESARRRSDQAGRRLNALNRRLDARSAREVV